MVPCQEQARRNEATDELKGRLRPSRESGEASSQEVHQPRASLPSPGSAMPRSSPAPPRSEPEPGPSSSAIPRARRGRIFAIRGDERSSNLLTQLTCNFGPGMEASGRRPSIFSSLPIYRILQITTRHYQDEQIPNAMQSHPLKHTTRMVPNLQNEAGHHVSHRSPQRGGCQCQIN
jgi:hypothetical protein